MSKDNNLGKSPIQDLFIELAHIDNALRAPSVPLNDERLGELRGAHWALREQIAATPVTSLDDLSWIAHALRLEIRHDPDFECHAPGCARELALAIANGVIHLAGAEQEDIKQL